MEFLPDHDTLSMWLIHYGSFGIFILLALGIIALPVPEETLLVISGILIRTGSLQTYPTLFSAYGGSICGITVSYILGKTVGHRITQKIKNWQTAKQHLDKAHQWFDRFGKWALFIGYFIPGVRHFTGLFAGVTDLNYRSFALFAYCGAVLWVSLFISVGYFFGNYGMLFYEHVESNIESFALLGCLILLGIGIYYYMRKAKAKE
jgi:membrane protein DedA with SNARE-associated domain